MSLIDYSKRVIRNYLYNYNITLKVEQSFEREPLFKQITEKGKISISTKGKEFGLFEYTCSDEELFIENVYVSENKNGSLGFLKIFLLYLLSLYTQKVKKVSLTAVPSYGNGKEKGEETCLACYYQKLGFKPIDDIEDMKKLEDYCLGKLKEFNREYQQSYSICILCDCQREYKKKTGDIRLDGFDFTKFNVRMDILVPELQRELKKAYKDILKDIEEKENK